MIVAVLAIVIATHSGIFHVFSAVIDKEVPFTDRTAARHIAMAIVSVSFLSWLYFTCIFNRHLPFENNLPDALAARPYNQVRIFLLRLLPIALPCLLAAAMIHNVLPRIDPDWNNAKPLLGLATFSAFAVMAGVGFVFDDLCVRGLYKQRRALRRKLLDIRSARESIGFAADGGFSRAIQSFALLLIGLATRLRLVLVEAGNLFFNAPLVVGRLKNKRDDNLFESYFGTPEEQQASACAVWQSENRGEALSMTARQLAPFQCPGPAS